MLSWLKIVYNSFFFPTNLFKNWDLIPLILSKVTDVHPFKVGLSLEIARSHTKSQVWGTGKWSSWLHWIRFTMMKRRLGEFYGLHQKP